MIYQGIYSRLMSGFAMVEMMFIYSAVIVILGFWLISSPIFLINNGLVIVTFLHIVSNISNVSTR